MKFLADSVAKEASTSSSPRSPPPPAPMESQRFNGHERFNPAPDEEEQKRRRQEEARRLIEEHLNSPEMLSAAKSNIRGGWFQPHFRI